MKATSKAALKSDTLVKKYGHAWVFLYWLIYLPWFLHLEQTVTRGYHVLKSSWDAYIPFCEGFIVPYLLWFPFVAIVLGWFFFQDKEGFYRLTLYMFSGMTLFLVICTVFPNGLSLRPAVLPRDNVFTDLVRLIWRVDTCTNVLPSLHVYNSVVCCAAVYHAPALASRRGVRTGTLLLTISIVLSTMFLKQHSVIDVMSALVMARLLYLPIYRTAPVRQARKQLRARKS